MQADVFIKRRNHTILFFALMFALAAVSVAITRYDMQKGFTSFAKAFSWGFSNFYPDIKSLGKLPDILSKLRDTVLASIAATTIAAFFSLALALAGSRATRITGAFTVAVRGSASFLRNIPLAAWAMVLMLAFSQSQLTGFLALLLGSVGFLTRAFMEAIDEVCDDTVEALKAAGASRLQSIFRGVLPSSMPQLVSWLLFMVETNIRDAALVGMLTGTGIGFSFDVYYKAFDYHAASLVVIVTVAAVMATENISNLVRRMIL